MKIIYVGVSFIKKKQKKFIHPCYLMKPFVSLTIMDKYFVIQGGNGY